ncbi:acyl-CoA dehydrogenase family protein [Maricurvus nonylphenolicus]|uniref:acyl-CoA dehydrogenase family protein n=1 Tax=Maricurvus nonylphenolicus TaxID=1008307 RepID=UPI0036F3AE34
MNFEPSPRVQEYLERIHSFIDEHIEPNEHVYHEQLEQNRWTIPPIMDEWKAKAKEAGLWTLFLPPEYGEYSAGFSNLEYAYLAEAMGYRSLLAAEAFNCDAPDSGNMEVLAKYGTPEQKERWLKPLLDGEIRSAFAMTEPAVASSDATNIETSIVRDGDEYVINGRKHFTSGALSERCGIMILLGKTDPNAPKHAQQSQVLIPTNTPGITMHKNLKTFGYDAAPFGHPEVVFDNVRVPVENLILGEGRGFEIAQGRLGPGRVHHCMRLLGMAQRALEMMASRAEARSPFGKPLSKQQSVREDVALAACKIEQARLMTLKTAVKMDEGGAKHAADLIAMIKIIVPNMTCEVLDRAIQIHGGAGFSQEFMLARSYVFSRTVRVLDGPDEVHMMQLGRNLCKRYAEKLAG